MRSELLNGGAYARTAFQAINKAATGGSTGDAVEVDGAWVGRKVSSTEDGKLAMSAKLVIAYTTDLAHLQTLKFAVQMQDATAADGTGAADYGDAIASTTVDTGESGTATQTGTVEIDIDLSGAREFVRAQITPDLITPDTVEWSAVLVFFGDGEQPSTRKIGNVGSPT